MATAVQLEIQVDEHGAVQGIKAFDTELKNVGKHAQDAGSKGEAANKNLEKQLHQSHQAAQLFTRTLGVEMPRALETIIAKTPVVRQGLSAAFSASVIAASVVAVGEMVRHFD